MTLPLIYLSVADFESRSIMPSDDIAGLSRLDMSRAPDATALTASPEALVGTIPLTGTTVGAVLFTPNQPITASDTDYATFNVYKRTAGGARVLVATATTKITGGIGSMAPGIAYAIPVSAGAVAQGDQITLEVLKTGVNAVIVPDGVVVIVMAPGFVDMRLAANSAWINARLLKRYAVPFAAPVPEIVLSWQERLTTRDCYLRRGFTPGSAEDQMILDRAKAAEEEIKEAADSNTGLFELPLIDSAEGATGVSAGGPLGYSEASPYVAFDIERTNAAAQDASGSGT